MERELGVTRHATAWWMGTAFGAAAALAVVTLAVFGVEERGTVIALRATARLSFLLFWPAYTGSALAALFGPAFLPVRRYGRELGLAFASAHLVHVGLIAWLCWIGKAPAVSVFLVFGFALLWTYVLALFSIGRLQQSLSRQGWWWLRTVGMNYIAYAFALDFLQLPHPFGVRYLAEYGAFSVMSVVGPLLYFTAMALSIGRTWRAPS